jgi:hypothetical protein
MQSHAMRTQSRLEDVRAMLAHKRAEAMDDADDENNGRVDDDA